MWLLNSNTRRLEHFVDEQTKYGRYAILSHTWDEDEVSFQDIQDGDPSPKKGYAKIVNTCRQAIRDKLDYCWIDTCCIDKKSSAELSEAINSMFRWYTLAKVCYVHLADVPDNPLESARWFTRGWTLQELIAPSYLVFYNMAWEEIGTKHNMIDQISRITKIDKDVLTDRSALSSRSIACRMAWAAHRSTSRVEDRAYSLLGLFDCSMPMLYGEGSKAFMKLQEQIIQNSTDHSILAWRPYEPEHDGYLFAPSPYGFRDAHNIVSWSTPGIDESFQLSNKGLRIILPVVGEDPLPVAVLNCRNYISPNDNYQMGLALRKQAQRMVIPARALTTPIYVVRNAVNGGSRLAGTKKLVDVERKGLVTAKWLDLLILSRPTSIGLDQESSHWSRDIVFVDETYHLIVASALPQDGWRPTTNIMSMLLTDSPEHDRGYIVYKDIDTRKKFTVGFEHATSSKGEPELQVGITEDAHEEHFDYQNTTVKFRKGEMLHVECYRSSRKRWLITWTVRLWATPTKRRSIWSH